MSLSLWAWVLRASLLACCTRFKHVQRLGIALACCVKTKKSQAKQDGIFIARVILSRAVQSAAAPEGAASRSQPSIGSRRGIWSFDAGLLKRREMSDKMGVEALPSCDTTR